MLLFCCKNYKYLFFLKQASPYVDDVISSIDESSEENVKSSDSSEGKKVLISEVIAGVNKNKF